MSREFKGSFVPREADAVAVTAALWRHHLLSPTSIAMTILIGGLAIGLFYLTLVPMVPLWIIVTAVWVGIPLTIVLVIAVGAPIAGRRHYRQAARLQSEVKLEWDEHGIDIEVERGSSRYRWDEFLKWSLGKRYLILFLTDAVALAFPRSVFGHGEGAVISGLERAGIRRI